MRQRYDSNSRNQKKKKKRLIGEVLASVAKNI